MPEDNSRQPLRWAGSCLEDVRTFPENVQDRIGFDLDRVQRGEQPRDFKYMKTVGKGVYEIRARGADGTYRVFYIARFKEAIYALHAFQKKTQETPQREIETGQRRLERVKQWRKRHGLD